MTPYHAQSIAIHCLVALIAGGFYWRSGRPAPQAPPLELAEAPEPPAKAPEPPKPQEHQEKAAAERRDPPTPPPAPPAPTASTQPPATEDRRALEKRGASFFASGGNWEDLPLRWSKMTPDYGTFLSACRATIWVYSETNSCYVGRLRLWSDGDVREERFKTCNEASPAHAVGGRAAGKDRRLAGRLREIKKVWGDSSLVFFTDHTDLIRRYIAGAILQAMESRGRRLEGIVEVIMEGVVEGGEPTIMVRSICGADGTCS